MRQLSSLEYTPSQLRHRLRNASITSQEVGIAKEAFKKANPHSERINTPGFPVSVLDIRMNKAKEPEKPVLTKT